MLNDKKKFDFKWYMTAKNHNDAYEKLIEVLKTNPDDVKNFIYETSIMSKDRDDAIKKAIDALKENPHGLMEELNVKKY